MKIGIITLLDEKNYGSRWQNYAMNCLLQSVGLETTNIYIWERNANRKGFRESIKRILPLKIFYTSKTVKEEYVKVMAFFSI